MRFDPIDLRLFVAIAEAGSISRGAQAANLALASASARVAGMEALVGAPLLERGRRGAVPTAAGRALIGHARILLGQMARMREDLAGFTGGAKGRIRLLSNTAALVELLPAALGRFLAAHPDVDIDVEERTSADIVSLIAEERAELGLVADTVDPGRLALRPLAPDRLVVLMAANHRFALRPSLRFAELLDEPFVGLSAGAIHDHLADHAARLGRRIDYRVRLRGFDTVARLIAAGVGIGVVPLAASAPREGLAIVPLADAWAERRLALCARSFEGLGRPAAALVAEIEAPAMSGG